jgi:hypothetical protein
MAQSRHNTTTINEQLLGAAPLRCSIISKEYPPA